MADVKNILTPEEGARVVGTDPQDARLLDVLPQVDAAIRSATGYDWTQDDTIKPEAKRAARLVLALEYDLMSMEQQQIDALTRAKSEAITALWMMIQDTDSGTAVV